MLVFKILEDIIFLWTLLPMCGSKMRFEIGENQIDNQHPEPNSIANRWTFLLSDMRRHWRSLNNAAVWSDDICHGTLWSLFWKWSIMGGVENGTSARGERMMVALTREAVVKVVRIRVWIYRDNKICWRIWLWNQIRTYLRSGGKNLGSDHVYLIKSSCVTFQHSGKPIFLLLWIEKSMSFDLKN